jgi:O-methyltransferase
MLAEIAKNIAKRNQTIVRLYSKWCFLCAIPAKDFMQPSKVKLAFAVKPYTMLSYPRLSKLYEVARRLHEEGINGSFVECGVWNGGSAGMVTAVAKNDKARHCWLFDSWEGLPEPSEYDISRSGEKGKRGMALGSEEKVREVLFQKLKLSQERSHLIKGWFRDTLPVYKKHIGSIALLHLDCDWYESVKFCLDELYDSVIQGGFIFIDDYGYWSGCKKATDQFITERNQKIDLIEIDCSGVYFEKP